MIFNLFKSRPTLSELIPNGFVDIHSHVLPGIDDGAKNIEQSINMIKEMKKLGFCEIIGTPHTYLGLYENTNKSIKKSYNLLKPNLPNNINLSFASEYMLDMTVVDKAQKNNLLCIKDNLVLVELSYVSPPINLHQIIFEIILNGYTPVIAHPERYLYFHNRMKELKKLKKNGCLFQMNLLSTTNYYGKLVSEFSDKLLKNGFIDFVGSDIHNIRHLYEFEKKIKIRNVKELNRAIENNCRFYTK